MRYLLAALLALAACAQPSAPTPEPILSSIDPLDAHHPEASLPPLPAEKWVDTLDNDSMHVGLPIGVTRRVPVVVGVHGAGDKPEWSCSEWLAVTEGHAFVVCPHGVADARWAGTRVWSSATQIANETVRALAALHAAYGDWIEDGPVTYGAWSQGATLAGPAVKALHEHGVHVDRAILVEIGHTPVDARETSRAMKEAGVLRVVVSCSSGPCRDFSNTFRAVATLPVKVVDVGNRGHWFDEPVFQAIASTLPWLDAR